MVNIKCPWCDYIGKDEGEGEFYRSGKILLAEHWQDMIEQQDHDEIQIQGLLAWFLETEQMKRNLLL